MKILVVDDDESIRKLLLEALKGWGYSVSTADGGMEALRKIKRARYDLVVLDINMPDISGYDVLRAIRILPVRKDTKVLVVTANGFDVRGLVREAESGIDGHLMKPFSLAELRHTVESIVAESGTAQVIRLNTQARAAGMYRSLIDLRDAGGEDDEEEAPRRRGLLRR